MLCRRSKVAMHHSVQHELLQFKLHVVQRQWADHGTIRISGTPSAQR
jgi:hypothetical protein